MELLLWRHAEAAATKPDIERALTLEGQQQATAMADWLRARMPKNIRILASPARRAQETVQALDLDFITRDDIGPGAEPEAILKAADWPHGTQDVLIVSHQPSLGAAAALPITGHAPSVADGLRARRPKRSRHTAGPERRAEETGQAIVLDFVARDDIGPGAEREAILKAADWPHGTHDVLIVSHQPSLGAAAALAITGHAQYWGVDIGNVWWLST